jgi:DNA-binding NarL/FixJ family response regulator
MHQRIYGWIVEAAGYRAIYAQVLSREIRLPEVRADLVLLDYHLGGKINAVETAKLIHSRLPKATVVVLSDALALPEDIAPHVQGFIRKGDPPKLVETIHKILQPPP